MSCPGCNAEGVLTTDEYYVESYLKKHHLTPGWVLCNLEGDPEEHIQDIKFCPFCGLKLPEIASPLAPV